MPLTIKEKRLKKLFEKEYTGKKVPKVFQKKYGSIYSKKEADSVFYAYEKKKGGLRK